MKFSALEGLTRVAALGSLASLAACGSTRAPSNGSGSSTPSGTSSTVTVPLSHAPTGTVNLSWSSSTHKITAHVAMSDFTPGSSHALHIHQGSCSSQGPVAVDFPDVTANAVGAINESVTAAVPSPAGIPTAHSYFNIHLGNSSQISSALGFTPLGCANILAGSSTASDMLTVSAPPQSGLHPSGSAKVTYSRSAKMLSVTVRATGLPPNTSHAAHVHLGSCASQGSIKYDLKDIVVGSTGSGVSKTVFHNVTSPLPKTGWYVNVHFGSSKQIVANGSPTIYFQPVLCGSAS